MNHILRNTLLFGALMSALATPVLGRHQQIHRSELAAARAQGATVVEDYGDVLWVQLDGEEAFATYALDLGLRRFDALHDSQANRRVYGAGAALRLVQFTAPPRQQWLDALQRQGATPIQYIAPFSYVVWSDAQALSAAARLTPQLRWSGEFLPEYKQNNAAEGLRRGETEWQAMLYRGSSIDTAVFSATGARSNGRSTMDQHFDIVTFEAADAATIQRLAALPGVYSLQPRRRDGGLRAELANQITAGNFSAGVPALGYLSWLTGLGLNGNGVVIANVDGGIFDTHPDLIGRMLPCVGDTCGGSATDDHGSHTAAIMAGDGQSAVVDANGYRRGLGMAPGANLVEQVYSPTFTQPGGMLKLMRQSHDNNADLSGNSWGPAGSPVGYDADTRQVDVGVRDTKPDIAGDQPLTYVLSFMNGNGGTSSQGSPDEGKNMITVGSTKAQTSSGAFITAYNDVSANSAHGPALDGRRIPHLVAPGCSVDSAASATGYALMCGTSMASPQVSGAAALFIEHYRHLHAGADPSAALIKAALVAATQNLVGNTDADGVTLGNRPDNKQGWGRLRADWMLAPGVTVLYYDQDTQTFDNTGESWTLSVSPEDPAKPVQVVLVYTDAPGHGTGGSTPAWNNDLDLRVESGGDIYRGNVFGANGFSTTGGSADIRNNIEVVSMDAATAAGGLAIEVVASNLTSNALPNSGDATDQDFALVCVNCLSGPAFGLAAAPAIRDRCGPGDVDWTINVGALAGYTGNVALSTDNVPAPATTLLTPDTIAAPGSADLTLTTGALADGSYLIDIQGEDSSDTKLTRVRLNYNPALAAAPSLSSPADAATDVALSPLLQWAAAANPASVLRYRVEIDDDADFSSIEYSAETADTSHQVDADLAAITTYHWRVTAINACGESPVTARSFTTAEVYCATPAVAIPDGSGNVTSNIVVASGNAIADLDVALVANHGWVGDLVFTLTKVGSGTTVTLLDRPGVPGSTFGCEGDNINIVLDDEEPTRTAEGSCSASTPAYIAGASYRPNQALSAFDGSSFAGTWTLTARDAAGQFAGTLQSWCLQPQLNSAPPVQVFGNGFE
jgi:serine protease AprX